MKRTLSQARLLTTLGALVCLPLGTLLAEDTNSVPPAVPDSATTSTDSTPEAPPPAVVTTNTPAKPTPAVSTASTASAPATGSSVPAKLPYGVDDIVKLKRAQISEEVIVTYVLNSGTVYNLTPNDIVNLRNEGLSDRVVTTMMNQRQRVPDEAAQQVAQQQAIQQAFTGPLPESMATAPVYAPNYVEPPAPEEPTPSSLYVIPYEPVRAAYYGGYYPRYYYGGYCAPGASVVYRFGHGYGGYYRYGWRR